MAEHANFRLLAIQPGHRLRRHLPSFIQHMTEGNPHSAPKQEASAGKPARFVAIHIAGDRRDRRKSTQASNHLFVADIAGMQDFLDPAKMRLDRRIVDPMGVGDHSDPKRTELGQRLAAPADA
jgi:hypothetical protein